MNRNIVFCGTPLIAVKCIQALIDKGYKPKLVITQPDKLSGRKKEIVFSPVKKFCIENDINFIQPTKISEAYEEIKSITPDLLITCAYGQFIPDPILSLPTFYSINIHASLLPKYRGGAPIHWSIINGENETGITIMEMVKKMDAGDIFFQEKVFINDDDTLETLFNKMEDLAYKILYEKIDIFFTNNLKKIPQDETKVSFGYNITREDEKISFEIEDFKIYNKIRGLNPIPGAFFTYSNKIVKVYKSIKTDIKSNNLPGTIVKITNDGLQISTKTNDIIFSSIKIEGKSVVSNKEILNYKSFFKINDIIEE